MIRAVIFDCFGVLCIGTGNNQQLNEALAKVIRESLKPAYKVGLLSNIHSEWMDNFLDQYQIRDLFDTVVVSEEEGITKSDPEIFIRTANKLGVRPEECIVIDDSPDNCAVARKAGMEALLYDDTLTPQRIAEYLEQKTSDARTA